MCTLAFAYVTAWLILLPVLDPDPVVQAFFPDPVFAFLAAAAILCAIVLLAGTVAGCALITHKETDAQLAACTQWEFRPPAPESPLSSSPSSSSSSSPHGRRKSAEE